MMDDETRRAPDPSGPEPDKSTDADCRRETFGSQEGAPSPLNRLVVAFVVTKEHDGSVMLSTPLTDGSSVLRIVTTRLSDDDLAQMRALPIHDLTNPGVALVVRSSVERLVKAARNVRDRFPSRLGCSETDEYPVEAGRVRELEAALEPFKDVAP